MTAIDVIGGASSSTCQQISMENNVKGQKTRQKLAVLTGAGHWSYFTRPLTTEDYKEFKSWARQGISDFVKFIHEYSAVVFNSTGHLGTLQDVGQSDSSDVFKMKSRDVVTIIDRDIPDYALFLSLILRPRSCQDEIPEINQPRMYSQLKSKRTDLFIKYLDPSDVKRSVYFPNSIKNLHYVLYHYNVLVAEVKERQLIIHSEKLFHKCLYGRSLSDLAPGFIFTAEMVEEVIEYGLIPEASRSVLMRWVGHNIGETLMFGANVYGNISGFYEILEDEIDVVGGRKIFEAVSYLLIKYAGQKTTILAAEPTQVVRGRDGKWVRKVHPDVQQWLPIIKLIDRFFSAKCKLQDLKLEQSNATEINLIRKVLLLSFKARNFIGYKFVDFDEARNLKLIAALHKICPMLETSDTFQWSVNPSRIKDIRRWVDPNNWISPRAAQQARAYSIMWDSAVTLHQSGYLNALIGARANSGGGKSTFIRALLAYLRSEKRSDQSEPNLIRSVFAFMKNETVPAGSDGVVSPDDAKAFLKRLPVAGKDRRSLNSQVHFESKVTVFEPIMQKLRDDPEVRYIADQRFLSADEVMKTLIIPAEKKGCPAILLDMEVPLTHALMRMLARPALGDEPSQASDILVDGYTQCIRQRKAVIDLVKESEAISEYALVYNDRIVAEKFKGRWSVNDQEAYDRCVEASIDMQERIQAELSQVITFEMIDALYRAGRLFEHQIPLLRRWEGWPLGEAVDRNARNQGAEASSSTI